MTRKDYELLAGVFARTRPNPDDDEAGYAAWETTIRALCDALENDNPAFNRMRFQFAATGEARAKVWLVDYRFDVPTEDEALQLAGSKAERDVPGAAANFIRSRRTPKGTWVVTLKRTRA